MHTRSEAAAPLNPSEPHEVVNMSRARLIFALAALAALAALSACAEASVDQYTPINPELGGSTDVFGEVVVPPPVMRLTLARVGDRVLVVGERLEIILESQSPDDKPVEYSLRSDLPPGATFVREEGRFEWTPSSDQAGSRHPLTFEVTDGAEVASETITVRVLAEGENSALPPTVDPIGDQSLSVGVEWSLQVVASDPNGDPLTYALAEGAPEGLLISEEGALVWSPSAEQVGEHPIEVRVTAGEDTVSASARLVVLEAGAAANAPPVFDEPSLETLTVGQPFAYTFSARDEGEVPLTYGVEGAPEGALFDPSTGHFEWTPTNDYANTAVTLRVSANDGEFTSYLQVSLLVRLAPRDCGQAADAQVESFPINIGDEILARSLCNEGDIDNFALTLRRSARVRIDAIFTHAVGDVDIKLLNEAGESLYASLSVTDNESIETHSLEPGVYTLEVKLYRNGPVSYDLRVDELAEDTSCAADAFEGSPNNDTIDRAAPLPTGRRHDGVTLCRGDIDAYSFTASRGQTITLTFTHDLDESINMRLIGPASLISSGTEQMWSTTSDTLTRLAPESGTYVVLIGYSKVTPNATYSLTAALSTIPACMADRIEAGDGNDDPGHSEFLAPNLYTGLTSCADPNDWYRARPSGGGVRVFVGYNSPATAPTMTAVDAAGAPLPNAAFVGVTAASTSGCMSNRSYCYKATLPTPAGGGEVYFSVRFNEVGTSYDIRVQSGL